MLKKVFKITGGSCFLILTVSVLFVLLQPRIPLHLLSGPFIYLLNSITGHDQQVSGLYYLVPGRWTRISLKESNISLTGDEGFQLNAKIQSAETSIHLWSLFKGEVNLDGLLVSGARLDIHTGPEKKKFKKTERESRWFSIDFLSLPIRRTGVVELADIKGSISQNVQHSPIDFQVVEAIGELSNESSCYFKIKAIVNDREFSTDFRGTSLQDLGKEDHVWPFTLQLAHRSITAQLKGSIYGTKPHPLLTTDFTLSGKHLEDLLSIVGMHGSRGQPFAIQGSMELSEKKFNTVFNKVQLGTVNLFLTATVEGLGTDNPEFSVTVQSDRLDIDGLKEFVGPIGSNTAKSHPMVKKTKISRNDIFFPTTFPLQSLALELDFKELVIAGETIRDARLSSSLKNGVVKDSPFMASFRDFPLSGQYSLNLTGKEPKIFVHLDSSFINIGAILEERYVVEGIALQLGKVRADLETAGRTFAELVNHLVFTIHAGNGRYEYHDPNTMATLPVLLHDLKIAGAPGERITLETQGEIIDTPIHISMEVEDPRGEAPESIKRVSFIQNIMLAGMQLELAGKIPLPFVGSEISLECRLRGEQLSSVNGLLNLKLPDIGSYDVSGILSIVPNGYRFDGISLRVGSSTLAGNVFLDTKVVPPATAINLQAHSIQLNDFKEIWIGTGDDVPGKSKNDSKKPKEYKKTWHSFTEQAVLDRYNASVSVVVEEVFSGEDYLGKGLLKIELQDGTFRMAPLQIQFPKGSAQIDLFFEPADRGRRYTLNANIDDLDYGFIGRWFKPDSKMSGSISLRTSLESESPDIQNIMTNGSGYFDFMIQPEKLQPEIIDIWAVNLLNYLVSSLVSDGGSKFNCAAGRFTLSEGMLSRDKLLLDTSRVRVSGNLVVDFHKQWVKGRLRPRPKRSQFFSLATPIKISGPLSNLDMGLAAGSRVGTLIRLATSPIVVPIQWLVLNKLPKDGTAACLQILERQKQKERPSGY